MKRKLLVMSLLCFSMAFLMQCSNDAFFNDSATVALKAGKGPGGGGHTEPVGNNLSFPVIRADGFGVTTIGSTTFEVPYTGDYTGLTQAEIDALIAGGPWYPQKTEGNAWQAGIAVAPGSGIDVDYVDWGDVIEAVKPTIGRPFRLEVTLYALASKGNDEYGNPASTLTRYTMAVLENPSSPDELQGTNMEIFDYEYATVASSLPKLVIQYMGDNDPASLLWDGDSWQVNGVDLQVTPISFAPELNVGGKYIYGASTGGWRPVMQGMYRLTFYMDAHVPATVINLTESTQVMNFDGTGFVNPETTASSPTIDYGNNITYVDVEVITKGGGGGGRS